jgi:hypothetical protein
MKRFLCAKTAGASRIKEKTRIIVICSKEIRQELDVEVRR